MYVFAEVLGAVDLAAVCVIAGVILYALRYSTRRLEVKLGNLHATVDHVNKAVNNRPEGDPTIYEAVRSASDRVGELTEKLDHFVTYQHDRNHEMMNELTVAKGLAKVAHDQVTLHLAAHQADMDRHLAEGQDVA